MQKHFTKLSKNVCPEHFSSPIDFYCKQRVALDRVGSAGRACRRLFRYDFCFFFKFFFSPSLISLQRLVSRHPRFLLPRTSVATPGISPGAAAAGTGRDPGGPGPPVPRGLLRRRDRLGCRGFEMTFLPVSRTRLRNKISVFMSPGVGFP